MNGKLNLPINTVIGVSLLVLLLVPALYFAKPVLLPMVISTFVALLFSPLINYFEDKGLPRTITVVVTLTLLVSFGFVAYLQLDSVSFMLTVVSIYLLLNLIESQFVTPTLLGRRFNLNPLVIFMWLVFWGWLWGGMGLLIGVPLLVCINILADRLALCGSTNI
ncbi:AI-2E family transporter [Vibrio parahaemolyticus]|nr:AI-2E family transporter [Vibrio parahaemolyticus]